MTNGLMKTEKPEEITLFINWFKYMFEDTQELVEEIKELSEVKSVLRTSIKKYGKKLVQEGFQEGKLEGKLETAANLIKEKMSVKKISEITGLPEKEIKKIKDK